MCIECLVHIYSVTISEDSLRFDIMVAVSSVMFKIKFQNVVSNDNDFNFIILSNKCSIVVVKFWIPLIRQSFSSWKREN